MGCGTHPPSLQKVRQVNDGKRSMNGAEAVPVVSVGQMNDYLQSGRQADRVDVFVLGHAAPDTDAIVSSVFEAYRRYARGESTAPVVQAVTVPREVVWLLGESADALLRADMPAVASRMKEESVRFVLTDHHEDAVAGDRVVGIVDHHLPPPDTHFTCADVCIQPVGASTSLVAECWQQDGLQPDAALARMMLGAILMDTEGLSPAKTRPADRQAAEWLTALAHVDPQALFTDLRAQLLAESDLDVLFKRDYRRFGQLGFAILKIWDTTPLDAASLETMLRDDRQASGCTVNLAKVTRYDRTGAHTDTYYLDGPEETVTALRGVIAATAGVADEGVPIFIPVSAVHLSRKRLAPILLAALE